MPGTVPGIGMPGQVPYGTGGLQFSQQFRGEMLGGNGQLTPGTASGSAQADTDSSGQAAGETAEEDAADAQSAKRRMTPGQMERHLKQRRRDLWRAAQENAEPETVQDDTTRLDVEAIVRAEQELLASGQSQYGSLEILDFEDIAAGAAAPSRASAQPDENDDGSEIAEPEVGDLEQDIANATEEAQTTLDSEV